MDSNHEFQRRASRHPGLNALLFLAVLLGFGWTAPANAAEVRLGRSLCHAVSARPPASDALPTRFACKGKPADYQRGSLWLHVDLRQYPVDRDDFVLLVHNTRFDRMQVAFTYADGRIVRQTVRGGDMGSHWRAGGQIAFPAPDRNVPLVALTLRFDRLASADLLRLRMMRDGEASMQSIALATSIGAALMLLVIGAIYNASLAFAVRRQFPAW
ncbi:hypothetical protein [Novosphingobium album (ex Liu et al. 2023)]|uniref:Uncharacterized protein n=1 Tax=Novosphingobium album (ex Liu et al. 2023) TaxID=3031130 RepID=A0ABT5WMD8_9SPHN|nr:hypothetical protein [Novosphingobium album (ex Liu et al. 2023)]MDE8651195.1 hypothetical protein [Novosphingobium album (ex Liu et al. 2023)]